MWAISIFSPGTWITLLCCAEWSYETILCRDDHILSSRDDCEPANPDNTLTDRLNTLLNSSGPGYILPLCPSTQYLIEAPILLFAPDQEISTAGYPSGDERAVLVVNGPVMNGTGHTNAVDGTCSNCDGVRLRNVQVRAEPLLWLSGNADRESVDQRHAFRCPADRGRCEHRDGRLEFGPAH